MGKEIKNGKNYKGNCRENIPQEKNKKVIDIFPLNAQF